MKLTSFNHYASNVDYCFLLIFLFDLISPLWLKNIPCGKNTQFIVPYNNIFNNYFSVQIQTYQNFFLNLNFKIKLKYV